MFRQNIVNENGLRTIVSYLKKKNAAIWISAIRVEPRYCGYFENLRSSALLNEKGLGFNREYVVGICNRLIDYINRIPSNMIDHFKFKFQEVI